MLPLTVRFLIKNSRGRGFNLWLPLFLLWILLLVLFILLSPFLLFAVIVFSFSKKELVKKIPSLSTIFALIGASRGLMIDIEDQETRVKIIIK